MSNQRIALGSVFTDLTLLGESGQRLSGYVAYTCKCVCGKVLDVRGTDLLRGHKKSCGCLRARVPNNRTHGKSKSKIHLIWNTMKNRCNNPNVKSYSYYGGRGITVCERWQKFENFLADMGERPDGCSLDRIDNSKGYSPENCRWATKEEQANNKRNNVMVYFNGETHSVTQWAKKLGINHAGMQFRLANWPLERAMTELIPLRPGSKLSDDQVFSIRKLALTETHAGIALRYNVSRPAISAIVAGKTYRDLLTKEKS